LGVAGAGLDRCWWVPLFFLPFRIDIKRENNKNFLFGKQRFVVMGKIGLKNGARSVFFLEMSVVASHDAGADNIFLG
jgi:hypothetical protein